MIGRSLRFSVVIGLWTRIFAERSVEEVLEGAKVRRRTVSCGLIFSLCDTFFDHRFKFTNVDCSGNIDHCRIFVTPRACSALSGFSDRPRSDFHVLSTKLVNEVIHDFENPKSETVVFIVLFSVLIVNINSANIALTICDNFISLHISIGCARVLTDIAYY